MPEGLVCNRCKVNTENLFVYNRYKPTGKVYYSCRECNRKSCKHYRNTPQGKLVLKRIVDKQRVKFIDKVRARAKLAYNLKVGNIVKPTQCSNCDSPDRLDGHHNDYSKPLDVVWLCRPCHSVVG